MGSGISSGPTPWWQLPEYRGNLQNLEQSAPDGYKYDPVKMDYVRTPESLGEDIASLSASATGGSLGGLKAAAGLSAGGGVTAGGMGINPASSVPGVAPIDNTAAMSAAFGKAKDQAGQSARASLRSLRGLLGETGQLGSGAEVQGTKDIVADALAGVNDVSRQQAITDANQKLDIAKTNQSAAITQRGQDIAAQEAQARLAQEAAQIQSQRQLELLRLALSPSTASLLY